MAGGMCWPAPAAPLYPGAGRMVKVRQAGGSRAMPGGSCLPGKLLPELLLYQLPFPLSYSCNHDLTVLVSQHHNETFWLCITSVALQCR